MIKLSTKIAAMLLGSALTIGVGVGLTASNEGLSSAKADANTATYTISAKDAVGTTGIAPSGSSATYAQTASSKGQMTKDNSTTLTLSGYEGCTITGLVLNMKSNSKAGSGTFSLVAGSTTLASISSAKAFNKWYNNTSFSTTYVDVTVSLTNNSYVIQDDETVVVSIAATANSLYINSYSFTYEGGSTPSAVEQTGDLTIKKYGVGDTWSHLGLSLVAVDSEGAEMAIDEKEITWSFNPTKPAADTTSVSVTATYGTLSTTKSYDVTVGKYSAIDFSTNFDTYASSWASSYGTQTLSATSTGTATEGTFDLNYVSKQTSTITNYPVFASKTNSILPILTYTISDPDETVLVKHVDIYFKQWTTKTPEVSLYVGKTTTSTAVDSGAIGTITSLSGDIKDDYFTIGYNGLNTSSNVQVAIAAMVIETGEHGSFGTLDHIKISAAPNKLTYAVGEQFKVEGLDVLAFDGADETTAESKHIDLDDENLSIVVPDGYTFTESDLGTKTQVVTYVENGITTTATFDINVVPSCTFTKVTETPSDWSGDYLIVSTITNSDNSTISYALNSNLSPIDVSNNYVEVTVDNSSISTALIYSFSIQVDESDSTVTNIKTHQNKYIGNDTTSNGITEKSTALSNTISISDGAVTIAGSGGYTLSYNSSSNRFRYFKSAGTVELYKLDDNTAETFATSFLSSITCDGGVTAPSVSKWSEMVTAYEAITSTGKYQLQTAVASETGSTIEQCVARYDFIITKYGTGTYTNFMNRDLTSSAPSIKNIFNSSNTAVVISVIALISFMSLACAYNFKKKKEQ